MISVCVFCVSDKCSAEIEVERAVKSLEGAVGIHRKRADMAVNELTENFNRDY